MRVIINHKNGEKDLIFTLTPYFTDPVIILPISTILKTVMIFMKGDVGVEKKKEEKCENRKTENIDKVLQKYFNYKE